MTNEPQSSPEPEAEPTIIIDEDALHEQLDNSGYSVRPRGDAAGADADAEEIVEVEAEEVLVVLPDDYDAGDMAEDVGLMTHVPRPGEEGPKLVSPLQQAAAPPQRAEEVGLVGSVSEAGAEMAPPPQAPPAYEPAPVPASAEMPEVEDYGELPNFEAVEDITAFIANDGAGLEAPGAETHVATVNLSSAPRRGAGRWLSLAALVAIAVCGYLWGPQVYREYVEPNLVGGGVAQASGGQDGDTTGGDPTTGPSQDPVAGNPAAGAPDLSAFDSWLSRSVADNLGLDSTVQPEDR